MARMTQDQKRNLVEWLRSNRIKYQSDLACFKAGVDANGISIQASSAQACAYFRLVRGKQPYYRAAKPVEYQPSSNGSGDLVTAIQSLEAQRVEHETKIAEIDSILADLRNVLTASNR